MKRRFASLWFRYLETDWMRIGKPMLRDRAFVLAVSERGRRVIRARNALAEKQGVHPGMAVAEAKAFLPDLEVLDMPEGLPEKLLKSIGIWCIRYTPVVAMDLPDGLLLDISGCTHLWKGESYYLKALVSRLNEKGYTVYMSIASSPAAAWAMARFGETSIVEHGKEKEALRDLPPAALRLPPDILGGLHKLGMETIGHFMHIPPPVLRRRFGEVLLSRLRQAWGEEEVPLLPLHSPAPYAERLACLEPIKTSPGIKIAIERLLERLCLRLFQEGNGLRKALLSCYRLDGKCVQITIGTNRPSSNLKHLLGLFELKIPQIEPALGIELFILEGLHIGRITRDQRILWETPSGLKDPALAELLDRLTGKWPTCKIRRYLPRARYWPEKSIRLATSLSEEPEIPWNVKRPRPTRLLSPPEPIEVTAPIPDYPPMLFRYKGELHTIKKAEGPERIEQEWWITTGEHRDYYYVEDAQGQRYWIFRSGPYRSGEKSPWFLHGFFA